MPGFYNPYSKNPQYGQGISSLMQQMMQMQWLKKMFENPTAPKESNKEQPPTDKNPIQVDQGIANSGIFQSPDTQNPIDLNGPINSQADWQGINNPFGQGAAPGAGGMAGGMAGMSPQMKMFLMQMIQQLTQGQQQQPQMYGRPRQ